MVEPILQIPENLDGLAASVRLTGRLSEDVVCFLTRYGLDHTATHCAAVARVAGKLAARFGMGPASATAAGWLHDISAVIPNGLRLRWAYALDVPIVGEEIELPTILHQKLSAALAEAVFDVHDTGVLEAVRCHTTLHPRAGALAKVVFLADKIAWDQVGVPPYLDELQGCLERSLDAAVCVYLDYLWARRSTLPVVHPWFAAAHRELCSSVAVQGGYGKGSASCRRDHLFGC